MLAVLVISFSQLLLAYRPPSCSNGPAFVFMCHTLQSLLLTYRRPPCSNGLAFVFMCHTLQSLLLTYKRPTCSNGLVFVFMCHTLQSLLLTYRPPPCSNRPDFVFMCHTLRFCATSFVILYYFMSSLMLFNHLVLGLHIVSLSLHSMFSTFLVVSSPSFLDRWAYHLSRLFLRMVVIGSMVASLQKSPFLMWSFLPLAHLSILISVVYRFCVSFHFTAQQSYPYSIAGLTTGFFYIYLSPWYASS